MMWDGDMGAWGWVGMSFMTLFWFGLVALIVWAIVASRPSRILSTTEGPRSDHALTILRERYARGEINADEYEQRRKILDDLDP
jgi:putative membrane protein